MTEKLYICPICQRPGFTLPGLRAHSCKGGRRLDKAELFHAALDPVQAALRKGEKPPSQNTELAVIEPATLVVVEPTTSEQFDQARTYLKMAKVSMSQGVAFMILCGVELNRLHKLNKVAPGQPKKNSPNVGGISWAERVKQEMGIGEETARRYMEMAHAAKKRIPLLNAEELLTTPLGELPELKQAELIKSVQKCTDGQTAQQFMWDFGIAKKNPGTGLRGKGFGGDKGGRRGRQTAEEKEAEANELADGRLDGLLEILNEVRVEKYPERWYPKTKPAQTEKVKTLKGELVDLLALVNALLK